MALNNAVNTAQKNILTCQDHQQLLQRFINASYKEFDLKACSPGEAFNFTTHLLQWFLTHLPENDPIRKSLVVKQEEIVLKNNIPIKQTKKLVLP